MSSVIQTLVNGDNKAPSNHLKWWWPTPRCHWRWTEFTQWGWDKMAAILQTKRIFFKTLRPRQDGRHFADSIFKCIFFNENCCILIKLSLKYVRKGPIDNNPAMVQIMAWRRSGDKPLSETMMISLQMHICVTQPQWDNGICFAFNFTEICSQRSNR